MWRNQKLDRPFLVTVAMLWLVNRRSGAGFSKPSIHANQQTGSQRVSKVSSWNKQNNSRLDLDCSESENTETETLEEYDKQINMVSFWRMTANLVIYYPHWNLHKVVHYILYPIFYRFHPKTHSEMCCQLSEVTPAVLTTPVSQSVSLDVSDKHGSSSRSTTLSR